MSIMQNIREVSKAVIDNEAIGELLKTKAVQAVIGGIESDEWEAYMKIFADNPEQLNRLRGINQPDTWDSESVAYLVSNAICGGASTGNLRQFINKSIDEGVLAEPVENFRTRLQ